MSDIIKKILTWFAQKFLLNNIMSGEDSLAIGIECTAGGEKSRAEGYQSATTLYGEQAYASGSYAQRGDAQTRRLVAWNVTSDADTASLFLDGNGSSERITVPQLASWTFIIKVIGRRVDATNESAGYTFAGTIHRDANPNTTRIVGSIATLLEVEDTAAWSCTASADTTNGALDIQVRGEAGKTILWVAVVEVIQARATV